MSKKLYISMLFIALTSSKSSYARLAGAEGTFRNIDTAINQAVKKTENLFEEFHGQDLDSTHKLAKNNPYLNLLNIENNYVISIKFADNAKQSKKSNNTVPVAKGLLGAEIILIPVFNQGDEKITAWECLTNADRQIQEFLGSTGTKNFTASLIREYTENQYLSLCTFVNKKPLIDNSGDSENNSNDSEYFDDSEGISEIDVTDNIIEVNNNFPPEEETEDLNNLPEVEESDGGFSFNPVYWFDWSWFRGWW